MIPKVQIVVYCYERVHTDEIAGIQDVRSRNVSGMAEILALAWSVAVQGARRSALLPGAPAAPLSLRLRLV